MGHSDNTMGKIRVWKIPGYVQEVYEIDSVRPWLFNMGSDNSIFVGGQLVSSFEELERLARQKPEEPLEVLVVAVIGGG